MVKETDVFNCSTGEFTGKGEFRQKIKVLKSIPAGGIQMLFNGQICNEGGCDNIRDVKIASPALEVIGTAAADQSLSLPTTPSPVAETVDTVATTVTEAPIAVSAEAPAYKQAKVLPLKTFNGQANEEQSSGFLGLFILAFVSGLTALLTPCVFPMIPMTVSFSSKTTTAKLPCVMQEYSH